MPRTPVVGVVVGNPRLGSRTTTVALEVADQVASALSGSVGKVVELADHAASVHDPDATEVQNDLESLRTVQVLVVASPTYKATYTGLLKSFVDRYGAGALDGVVAIPVMVGGAPQHALACEVHLRPLLVELGAVVPTRGLFVLEAELSRLPDVVGDWLSGGAEALRSNQRTAQPCRQVG
ncbi:NAD(P)H-dependent oxidoreductase [Antrihabitans sp. YC3-6]|uniref:NAD(P)H-dependent oxidoreductase n=1 Tax=Antrihabitans stalagmiti TaxID=2799499 RepID=A0A934U1C1_9NOCA|nr:NAD(P)H-dependent oxidoreductase [Antrihabitans stalagmiti]MBJ8337293.1 NAD(P)H-dependent oxidoreductase [Antrihabitans stalagmiti]